MINLVLKDRVIFTNFVDFVKVMLQFLQLKHAIVLLYLKFVGVFTKLEGLLPSFGLLVFPVTEYNSIRCFAELLSYPHLLVEKELFIEHKVDVILLKNLLSMSELLLLDLFFAKLVDWLHNFLNVFEIVISSFDFLKFVEMAVQPCKVLLYGT